MRSGRDGRGLVNPCVTSGTLKWLVLHLKTHYIINKRLHTFRKRGFVSTASMNLPEVSEKVWENAVKFFLKHKLNIATCVRIRFMLAGEKDVVPINTIALAKYLDRYEDATSDLSKDLGISLVAQQQVCRDYILTTASGYGFSGKELFRFVLLNETLELTPLFRYCLAVSEKLPDVEKRYSKLAMRQYLTAPQAHRKAWGNWIPLKFIAKAIRIAEGWNYA